MEHAERPQELPIPELAALRQCLAELDLPSPLGHRLTTALTQSEAQVRQRLDRAAQQAQRSVLLSNLAANMVHEVRNPLNAIFLHLDVLEEEIRQPKTDSPEQMTTSLTDIRIEVTRLYDALQDYLVLERLTTIERTPEDLGAFLKASLLDSQEQARTRGLTLHCEGLTHLGRVCLHQSTLRLAVRNLLQYALNATPPGDALTLRGRRTAQLSTIMLRYPGEPIPEEELALFFEPFQTTSSTSLGLGLYVAREIIAAHRGTIEVHSTADKGITFTITLPLVIAAH